MKASHFLAAFVAASLALAPLSVQAANGPEPQDRREAGPGPSQQRPDRGQQARPGDLDRMKDRKGPSRHDQKKTPPKHDSNKPGPKQDFKKLGPKHDQKQPGSKHDPKKPDPKKPKHDPKKKKQHRKDDRRR